MLVIFFATFCLLIYLFYRMKTSSGALHNTCDRCRRLPLRCVCKYLTLLFAQIPIYIKCSLNLRWHRRHNNFYISFLSTKSIYLYLLFAVHFIRSKIMWFIFLLDFFFTSFPVHPIDWLYDFEKRFPSNAWYFKIALPIIHISDVWYTVTAAGIYMHGLNIFNLYFCWVMMISISFY